MISNNSFFKEIPVIDISPLVGPQDNPKSLRKRAKEIENACKNIGFFYVKNHQIPQNHLDAVILVMQEFFNLPEEEKMKILARRVHISWVLNEDVPCVSTFRTCKNSKL